jgi:hypothetical protein
MSKTPKAVEVQVVQESSYDWKVLAVVVVILLIFLLLWYFYAGRGGPYFPSSSDAVMFTSSDFSTWGPGVTATVTIPKSFVNSGTIYPSGNLAAYATSAPGDAQNPNYVVFVIPAASSLKVGDSLVFVANQTTTDTSTNSDNQQYYGFYENEAGTDFNGAYIAIQWTNLNAKSLSKHTTALTSTYVQKAGVNRVELQVFDFGAGNVWAAFGGFSDAASA